MVLSVTEREKDKVGAFNTTYDTYRSRAFDPDDVDSYRFTTEFADGSAGRISDFYGHS